MAFHKRFGKLLSEGIVSAARRQKKSVAETQQEIAESLGYTHHNVEYWRRGHLPQEPEQVAFLARYCVQRGRVDRDWVQGLLTQAHYPERESLLQELFPRQTQRVQAPRIYQNLPPRYGDFVGREADMDRVLEGLASRWPLISIEGLGGIGKSTLAIETGRRCLPGPDCQLDPPFEAVVWVSAKDRPEQKRWLNEALDAIARVLDYPYITQLPAEDKPAEVDQLLRAGRNLVIVDNFETIEDPDLERWMQQVPEPSKVLLTSRRAQMRSVWAIHLQGLEEHQALELIRRHARRLGLRSVEAAAEDELLPLAQVTEGNPKAIEVALGYVKYGALGLDEVVDHLYAASQTVGGLFEDLFARAWETLTEEARRVLLVAPFFVDTASKEALGAAAGLKGYRLDKALGQLAEMSLLDANGELGEAQPRYNVHPLTRAFARAKTQEQPAFEKEARRRQATFYEQQLVQYEHTPASLPHLEERINNVLDCIRWYQQAGETRLMISLVAHVWQFCNVLGMWDEYAALTDRAVEACEALDEPVLQREIVQELALITYSRRQFDKSEELILEAKRISEAIGDMEEVARAYKNLGLIADRRGDYDVAENFLRQALDMAQQANSQREAQRTLRGLARVATHRNRLSEARELFEIVVSSEGQFARRESLLPFAHLLILQGEYARARSLLAERQESPDLSRNSFARVQRRYAEIEADTGNYSQALTYACEAQEIFHRLGMRQEETEMMELIAHLEETLAQEGE